MGGKLARFFILVTAVASLLNPNAAFAVDAKDAPVKVGFITCLSGVAAVPGQDMVNGIKLYFDQRNYRVAGRKIDLVIANDASSPTTALEKVKQLVNEDKIDILDGTLLDNISYAVTPLAEELQIPFVGAVCVSDDLTQRKHFKWLVRTGYTASQPTQPFGEYAYKVLGYRKVVTFSMNYPFGWEVVGGFQKSFEEAGGKIIQKLWPPLGFQDFSHFVKDIRKDADAVFMCNVGSAAQLVPKQYKEFGPGLPLIGMGTTADESTLSSTGDALLGAVTTLLYCPTLETPANKKFVKAYELAYNKVPSYYAECGYTSGMWIEKALISLKGDVSNKEKVLAALKAVSLSDAPRGPIKLDSRSSPIENIYVRKVVKAPDGTMVNKVIHTFPNVSQFWKWGEEEECKHPVYSRDYPPCTNCL